MDEGDFFFLIIIIPLKHSSLSTLSIVKLICIDPNGSEVRRVQVDVLSCALLC